MAQYLIVTHKTAFAPELRDKVRELIGEDANAVFAILVPESPGENYTWEGETISPAQETAEALMESLETSVGARVNRIAVGPEDPLQAIAGELSLDKGYDALVVSTLPLGVSHWLRMDLVHQAARKFGLPVHHVIGTPVKN